MAYSSNPNFSFTPNMSTPYGPGRVVGGTTYVQPSPATLGRSTSNESSNNNDPLGGFNMDLYKGWDRGSAEQDYLKTGGPGGGGGGDGGGGGGEQDFSQLISDAYSPALEALLGFESSATTGRDENIANIEGDLATGLGKVGTEETTLQKALDEQGRRLGESSRSAYADATRSYNNLIQQGLSRFGAGSSAGPAVQELVNQEFLRSRGKMGRTEVEGQQQLVAEQQKLSDYVTQKRNDLEEWKKDAVLAINQNFRSTMDQIASQRGQIESNKTRDKIAALQSAKDQAQQVKNADMQYRMGLAEMAVEQMQTVSGRAFSPQEIASVVNQMMGQELNIFSSNTGGQGQQANYNPYYLGRDDEDQAQA